MALINTIREKSGWAVGIIAIGLLLFIVGGDLIGGRNRLFGGPDQVVGEVNGSKIELAEFLKNLESAKQNFAQQQGRPPDEATTNTLREQTWNQLFFRRAFQPELDKLGLVTSPEELVDLVQGDNPTPAIKQAFTDPKTGQFDKARVQEYLRGLKNAPPQSQQAYQEFENGLRDFERPVAKYNALLRNSVYVTAAEAKAFDQAQNAKASFRYLFVPYSAVPDSAYKPTDAQLRDYLERHRARYKVEDGRSVEYIIVPETATKEDSAALRKQMDELATQFRSAPVDSLFVRANSEQPYNRSYYPASQLPAVLTKQPLTVGQVYGPMTVGNSLALFKVTGEKPRTQMQASHILFQVDPKATLEQKAEIKAKAEGVLKQIKGGADFAAMAKQYGSDGTKDRGGDLGFFDRASMVKPFADAVFGAAGNGLLPNLVETNFGYHIVKVTGRKTEPTYQLASVLKAIQPSDASREAAYSKADQLVADAPTLAAFRALPSKDKTLQKQEAKFVPRDAQNVGPIQNAREIVRWAYGADGKTKVGDIRKFDIGEQHVIAALTDTRSKGTASLESIRPELTAAVRNELKAKALMAKLSGKAGSLEDLTKAAGSGAVVQQAEGVAQAQGTIPNIGFEPAAVGRAFALKPGQKSAPVQGEQGVFVVEGVSVTPPPAAADLKALRQQLTQQRQQRQESQVIEAIKNHAKVEDNRVKFF